MLSLYLLCLLGQICNNGWIGKAFESLKESKSFSIILWIVLLLILGVIGAYLYYGKYRPLAAGAKKPAGDYLSALDKAIKQGLNQGYTKDELRKAILEKGWSKEITEREIDKVFGRK